MRIRLLCNDRVLHEAHGGDIATPIEIGRSPACTWQLPQEDSLISSRHAVLERQGKDILLSDRGSKNGTWFEGKRIEKRKLRAGDRLTLGRCLLLVEQESEQTAGTGVAEVLVLTGKQRNQRKPLQGGRFTIGSDPASDLLFLDELVSRNHALIARKDDGSFWLKDLDSTNGTRVNDVPLRAQQERLLKDGDRIAISHVEFSFHDGTGNRNQGQALLRMGLLAAFTVVALVLYFGWQFARTPASECLHQARQLAQAGRFAESRRQLEAAIGRRGYKEVQGELELLRKQVSKSESAARQWQAAQERLKAQDWLGAATQLNGLLSLPMDAWGWGEGKGVRDRAHVIKRWLDACLDTAHPEQVSRESLCARAQALAETVKGLEGVGELAALRKYAIERQGVMSGVVTNSSQLDLALQRLGQRNPPPDPNRVFQEVAAVAGHSNDAVREKAEKALEVLRSLVTAHNKLTNCVREATRLRFREALAVKVDLPSPDDCVFDANLTRFRGDLENQWANFRDQGATAERLVTELVVRLGSPEAIPSEMQYWSDAENLSKVLACDSLSGAVPRRARKEPQGEYDHAVCVEWFYASLRAIADPQTDNSVEAPFESRLAAAMRTVRAAKASGDFFAEPSHRWLLAGQLAQWAKAANRILELRDHIVSDLTARGRQSSGREAVIAGGAAWQLTDAPDKAFREWLTGELTNVRREVKRLYDKRSGAPLAEKIALRQQILKVGLPGDPIVKEMWVESGESGAGAGGQ
ncbi:MAG: FHA domain-containing protein [Verrucomicrobiota bacterium]